MFLRQPHAGTLGVCLPRRRPTDLPGPALTERLTSDASCGVTIGYALDPIPLGDVERGIAEAGDLLLTDQSVIDRVEVVTRTGWTLGRRAVLRDEPDRITIAAADGVIAPTPLVASLNSTAVRPVIATATTTLGELASGRECRNIAKPADGAVHLWSTRGQAIRSERVQYDGRLALRLLEPLLSH